MTRIKSLVAANQAIRALKEEYGRATQLLDAMPLACRLWNEDIEVKYVNAESLRLFGMQSEQEFIEHHLSLHPECQPDGSRSKEKIVECIKKAFAEGKYAGMWMHQTLDGMLIPTEDLLVRIPQGDGVAVAWYSRDLREHGKMISEIGRRNAHTNIMNRISYTLLQSSIGSFEDDLCLCMGIMAETIGVSRICIWKNRHVEGQLHRTRVYEWPCGAESQCRAESQQEKMQSDIPYQDIPDWEEMLSRGYCIHGRVRDLSAREQATMLAHGFLSVFMAPVFLQERFWGLVGYYDSRKERTFSEDEQSLMRSGGLVIASALLQNETVTNLKITADHLESALEKAKIASEAKDAFLANMSHEMRTPLNAIIGLSDLAIEEDRQAGDSRRECEFCKKAATNFEKIHSAGTTLLHTVNDILDISKIESGKFELSPVKYDVPSLLNDVMSQNVFRLAGKAVKFVVDIDKTLPAWLFGDDLRVKQIFNNLLSNAFKFTREGMVEFGVRCDREDGTVWMTAWVRDTGPGIQPDDLSRLFTDYSQLGTKDNREVEGTGLGLSITKKLVEMMEGVITAESEYGKGSVFTVKLRQGVVSDTRIRHETERNLKDVHYFAGKRSRQTRIVRRKMSYARVLVVDDNAVNLDVAKGLLELYGMKVDCVQCGREAVDAIRGEKVKYNAVFMDHMMPGMDGIEATRIIREEVGTGYARSIPVIALTANAIIGNKAMFLAKGFQDFIAKPIDPANLNTVLEKWVRDKAMEGKPSSGIQVLPEETKPQIFPERVDGIDLQRGFERFDCDENKFLRVLHSYVVNTPPLLEILEKVDAGNMATYAITVHSLKGASRGIYADRIGEAAEALEKAATAGDFAFVSANTLGFLEDVRKLLVGLEEALRRINPKPARDNPDATVLSRLATACEAYDIDGIDAAMAELEVWRYTADRGLAAWLRDRVDRMDYGEIQERISGLAREKETKSGQ